MLTIAPLEKALVPIDSAAAAEIAGPNYDEFQSDTEILEFIRQKSSSILKTTMPHCDVASPEEFLVEGSEEALVRSRQNRDRLVESSLTQTIGPVLYVYEMVDPTRPDARQIGLGCMARSSEIRTPDNPAGTIIRNEGIREPKMRGRAALVKATSAFIGTVNLAVDDDSGAITEALLAVADSRTCDYEVEDHKRNLHRIWLVRDADEIQRFQTLFAAEPHAYVADGNHRSAAAAMLGYETFLTVYFVAKTMRIDPYHRLIEKLEIPLADLLSRAAPSFDIAKLDVDGPYQPSKVHDIGVYSGGSWYRLTPKSGLYDPADAVQSIDSDILQRHLYSAILGIDDPKDKRLTFVGGDKGAPYLMEQVDAGNYDIAFSLAPVTMGQFIDVCTQGRYMPPKSTWFEPKIQSGLVIALL